MKLLAMRLVTVLNLIILLSTLNACAVQQPVPQSVAKLPEPPPPASTPFQKEFLQRINDIRSKGCNCGNTYMPPVPPVTWNMQLQMAAMAHAKDMNKNKYIGHINRSGKSSKDRIAAAGYTINGYRSYAVGENIAWGQRSIKEVMTGWIQSEGHCLNIMNKSYKEVGIYMENYYWVQEFGGRK